MIGRADIVERVREWGLREDVVEKDYVLGWLLWGIGTDPILSSAWVFKGGTCLKKCYIETFRFSEDLDFTVLPDGPIHPDKVMPTLARILQRIMEESGIDFSVMPPRLLTRASGRSTEGRIYYRGPRNAPVASVKVDLTADETVVRPPVLRTISHPYPETFRSGGTIRCYSFEELFAKKIRAMSQRGRPRDLYDIVNLFRRHDLRLYPKLIRDVLIEKCQAKGSAVPTFDQLEQSPYRAELESEWGNMLAHQLPALPPLEQFWGELANLFRWLEGTFALPTLESIAVAGNEDAAWSPPPTVASWRVGIPLETIRFAAANYLCVELGYQGGTRIIEPYSLRRTRDGHLILHAIRVDPRDNRSYRVDRIETVRVTTRPFVPVYVVEFASSGPLRALPTNTENRQQAARPIRQGTGVVYIVECQYCGRRFRRTTRDIRMRPHQDQSRGPCPGRRGYLVDTEYS